MKNILSILLIVIGTLSATAQGYKIGDVAKDFELTSTEGKQISMKSFPDAKGFIVIFLSNTCPYTLAYEDRVAALDKKYASQGYPVIAIMPNDELRGNKKSFSFPLLIDANKKIYPQFGATKTPQVFVLQKSTNGNSLKYTGAIDDNYQDAGAVQNKYVELAVDALLSNQPIKENQTRPVGCAIKF